MTTDTHSKPLPRLRHLIVAAIEREVCQIFEVNDPVLLHSRTRIKEVCVPRQVVQYFAMRYTALSHHKIAAFYQMERTTMLNSERAVIARMATEEDFREKVERIRRTLKEKYVIYSQTAPVCTG